MSSSLRAYLELVRPPNVVTAFADILAGFSAAWTLSLVVHAQNDFAVAVLPENIGPVTLFALLLATAGLYAGGVVLNDVFDAPLDALERPERPIPSGRVGRRSAAILGAVLLAAGIAAASLAGIAAVVIALLIALLAVGYDAGGKNYAILGPINMGLCRGGNLLLGVSAAPALLSELWYLALIPVAYIGAITAISSGEVHGGRQATGILAIALIVLVISALFALDLRLDYHTSPALPFILLFAVLVLPPFVSAAMEPSPDRVRKAVKRGVLSLIAMDAAIAAGFGGWPLGLAVLILLPVSIGLAKLFSVT